MTILTNYPNYSQLSAKINGPNDCVPTSIQDAVKYLVGVEIDVDAMVAAVYGPNYHGFTRAADFIPYCAEHGVKLFPVDGDNATLVQALHEQIKAGHPCLLTEPDPYAPLHPDWSHVLSVYAEGPGRLTARDPYSTHDVTHADPEWQRLLEFREIWALERIEDVPKVITIQDVASEFEELDSEHWKSKKTGRVIQFGLLADYKQYGKNELCGFTYLGHPISPEIALGPGRAKQHYQFGVRLWDNGQVSSLDLYAPGSAGQDPGLAILEAEIAKLKQQAQDPLASQALAVIRQVKPLVEPF